MDQGQWKGTEVAYRAEQIESGVLGAHDARSLKAALRPLTDMSHGRSNTALLYSHLGPARLVMLALAGYESPHARVRVVSALSLLSLTDALDAIRSPQLTEQVWLILAAQQDVLLQRIEDDLEALQSLDDERAAETRRQLGAVHKMLRTRSAAAVTQYLSLTQSAAPVSYGQA